MIVPERIARAAERRVIGDRKQIERSEAAIRRGVPLAAEPNPARLAARLLSRGRVSRGEAAALAAGLSAAVRPGAARALPERGGPEQILGDSADFVSVSFLERGTRAARGVARVAHRDGRPLGTGFLVSERLFLTNNHVIGTPEEAADLAVEFDYELDVDGVPLEPTRFALDPARCFVTDPTDDLDFTVIAVGPRLSGRKELEELGWCPLSDASDKHALGEVANVVQHPEGRYKEVVLRENRLVARLPHVLQYVADTEPGSSGAGVFNNQWQVIALHHWGGPHRDMTDAGKPVSQSVNEGIRVSAIVGELRARIGRLSAGPRAELQRVLQLGEAAPVAPAIAARNGNGHAPGVRVDADGAVTWQFPIELSVRLPMLPGSAAAPTALAPAAAIVAAPALPAPASEAAVRPSDDFSDRAGYRPRFLDGHPVELPELTAAQQAAAARNREAGPGDDPFELKYHHFSLVVNRERRLAFYTACNIDGATAKLINRKTGAVSDLDPQDPELERIGGDAEGAEASEQWFDDPRLDPGDYAGADVYTQQEVPGFPSGQGRTLRMFQRGHIVRRIDPAWGDEDMARLGEADTFHYTNASPQVGFFNMGAAPRSTPRSGGGRLWRAVENYVLRNAVAEKQRVTVFAGPVFADDDRPFRDVKVPRLFWKVAAWVEGGALRSIALLADQGPVIEAWPERIEDQPEAFTDPDELEKVQDFLSTVEEIERLTGLAFDAALREADVRAGQERRQVESPDDLPLRPGRGRARGQRTRRVEAAARMARKPPAKTTTKAAARTTAGAKTAARRRRPARHP